MRLMRILAACLPLFATAAVPAAELPAEIRIIVPVTAGSTLDARARVFADAIAKQVRRTVIVENRPGAGGSIGTLALARARPDGSTLLFTNNSHVISPHIYPDTGYDPLRDFTPVAQAYVTGLVLVAHPDLKVGTLADLVARAREWKPPQSYASSGTGGLPHLAMELLKEVAGIELLHVPYRGDGQALADVLAGRVPLIMSGYIVVQPHIKSGRLRALAVSEQKRSPILPDVPTIAEAGYPAFSLETWAGFLAPAGMPAGVTEQLNRAIAAALASPDVIAHLAATGAEAKVTPPAEFAAFVKQESAAYGKLVRKLHLKPE